MEFRFGSVWNCCNPDQYGYAQNCKDTHIPVLTYIHIGHFHIISISTNNVGTADEIRACVSGGQHQGGGHGGYRGLKL